MKAPKEVIRSTFTGVLWLTGAPGVGKSVFLARLAYDLGHDPRRVCRIAWRFKASDPARCNRAAFFRHAVDRLAGWLGRTDVAPGFDPNDVPDPTDVENLERPCGRGLMLMRYYMNHVAFSADGNAVSMTKLRNGKE